VKTVAAEQPAIEVRVSFMGELPSLIRERSVKVSLPRSGRVGDLMELLSQKYGDAFSCRVFSEPGVLRHTMLVFVDGENIKERGGLAAELGDGEVEVIMLPMFGGG